LLVRMRFLSCTSFGMTISEENVQECDATEAQQKNKSWAHKRKNLKQFYFITDSQKGLKINFNYG